MNPLQKYKAHSSQQFGRLRSNMFGENRLTDTCRAVFSKRAAPMSHDFFSCQGPRQAPCAGHALRGAPRRALLARTRLRWICNPVIPSHAPADCKSRRNIKDNHAETPKATIPKHRSLPRQSQPPPKEVSSQYGISAEETSRRGEVGLRQYRVVRWFLLP